MLLFIAIILLSPKERATTGRPYKRYGIGDIILDVLISRLYCYALSQTKRAAHFIPLFLAISLYYNVLLLNVAHNDTTSVSAYINSAVYLRVAADYLSNVAPLLCVIIDTLPCYSLVG